VAYFLGSERRVVDEVSHRAMVNGNR
jgi:hypothetical protein